MKKNLILLPVALIMAYFVFSSHANAPAGATSIDGTGATGFTNSCSGGGCHNNNFSTTVTITLDSAGTSVTRYVAGQTYNVIITGTNTSTTSLPKFGFQLTAVLATGAGSASASPAGTFATTGLPTGTTVSTIGGGSIQYCEQTSALTATTGSGGSGTTYVESFVWTAPAAGTGNIRFYGTVNAVNNDGNSTGDRVGRTFPLNVSELTAPTTAPITGTTSICVGGTTNLSDATAGGTWTSASTSIATISSSGVVTGLSAGSAVISYTASSGTVTTTITVNPVVTAGTISGTSSVCIGSTVTLSSTASGGAWSSGTPSVATISGTGVVTGVTVGTADITYTVMGACGTATATYSVNVSAGVTGGTISGATTGCQGLTVPLTETLTGGTWSSSAPTIASVNSAGIVYGVAAGSATISYSYTSGCGTGVATHAMTINASPSAGTVTGVPSVLCTSGTATLSASVSGGSWTSTNNAIATVDASGTVTGVSGGVDTIEYRVTGTGGCYSIASTRVAITAGPSATITSAGSLVFCAGSNVVLNANRGTGYSWQWYYGATPVAGATSSSYTVTTGGAYSVEITNSAGCTTPSTPVTASVVTVPNINTPSANVVCAGNRVNLSVPVVSGYTNLYQWKRNTINIAGATNATYTATTSGNYSCYETIAGGCSGITSQVAITVKSTLVPVITHSGNVFSTDTAYTSWQWIMNGTNIPGATSHSYTSATVATYKVKVTDSTGCTGISDAYVYNELGVQNAASVHSTIYPNPASNFLTVSDLSNDMTTYVIVDLPGHILATGTINNANNEINLAGLPSGNYLLKLYYNGGGSYHQLFTKN